MKPFVACIFVAQLLLVSGASHASVIRIHCDGTNLGAEVSVNGTYKGECPLDVTVPAGIVDVVAKKNLDSLHEQSQHQTFRIGEGVAKPVDIELSEPMLTESAQKELALRQSVQEAAEKAKRDHDSAAKLAAELALIERREAVLAGFRAQGAEIGNGKSFKDCADCPEMVLVPFNSDKLIAVAKYPVTVGEYAQFVSETVRQTQAGCLTIVKQMFSSRWEESPAANWRTPGFTQGNTHPVVCVSWLDAQAYLIWLGQKTGRTYVLPTTIMWASAAEADSSRLNPPWYDGDPSICVSGNFRDKSFTTVVDVKDALPSLSCDDNYAYTSPVGSYKPNKLGLFDIWGNVEELGQDPSHSENTEFEKFYAEHGSHRAFGLDWGWPANMGSKASRDLPQANANATVGFRVFRLIAY